MNNKTVIIVAGGKGLRMQSDLPKQFMELQGKPVLMHTIDAFFKYDESIDIVLVLPSDQIDFWKNLCEKHRFSIPHQIVEGGETRFHSVKNGLKNVHNTSLIAVHDGVRPLVSVETIARCFEAAAKHKAVVPVVELVDSIRALTNNGSKSVDRNGFRMVQTPQVFENQLLQKAYQQEFNAEFTDDASVVEAAGEKIFLVEGNRENIKITTSMDIAFSEYLLQSRE